MKKTEQQNTENVLEEAQFLSAAAAEAAKRSRFVKQSEESNVFKRVFLNPSLGRIKKQDKTPENSELNLIRRYVIIGERRFSHYWWTFIVMLGSCGFLEVGLSSYKASFLTGRNGAISPLFLLPPSFLPFLNGQDIAFFPQGLCLSFYGGLGFLLSLYWLFLIVWNVGGGFNEFNKKKGLFRLFRWGYPGKKRRIDFSYSLKDIEAITVEVKQGFDSQRTIYLKLKEKRKIPLTGIGEPLTFKEIEKQASELAHFLDVSLLT